MAGVNEIARAAGVHSTVVMQVFEAIAKLVQDEHVVVKTFGTFRTTTSPARTITSPQLPGGSVSIPERRKIRFRSAPTMKDLLNGHSAKAPGTPLRRKPGNPNFTKKQAAKAAKSVSRATPVAKVEG